MTLVVTSVIMILYFSVSAATNPMNCHGNKLKTFCIYSKSKMPLEGLPVSTELLRIEGNVINQLNSSIVAFKHLRTLELINIHLEKIHVHALHHMNRLESLTISQNNLIELQSDLFVGLDSLYILNLSHNRLVTLNSGVFKGLGRLRHLNLSHNLLEELLSGTFDGLRQSVDCELSKITSKLDLSFNPIYWIDIGAFEGLCRFTHLEMSNHELAVIEGNVFLGLSGLKTLNLYLGLGNNISKDAMRGLNRLTELNFWTSSLNYLGISMLKDSTQLKYLDFSYNNIQRLETGAFTNLFSLRTLLLNHNPILHLDNFVFEDLKSLRNLNISRNQIKTIEPYAFKGLKQLLILDLRINRIKNLNKKTFSDLVSLRELLLRDNNRLYISDARIFLGLPFLKCLYVNNALQLASAKLIMPRLDILRGSSKSLEDLQVAKLLDLTFAVKENVDLEASMKEQLKNINFVQKLHVTVTLVRAVTDLQPLSKFNVTSLYVHKSRIKIIESNGFVGFSNVRSLSIAKCHVEKIERNSFLNMIALRDLDLSDNKNLTLEPGSFRGLHNLENINLKDNYIGSIHAEMFEGLHSVKKLNLQFNMIRLLKPGVFQELRNIVELDLSWNRISNLSAGVFGAICRDDFKVTCENLTYVNQYCNETFALKTLRHLDLSTNIIKYIHPNTFVACSSLQMLVLRANIHFILGNDFLYTPGLMVLDMNFCNLTTVRNTTFQCTRQLSSIDLGNNKIKTIPVNALQHLKKLKVISFEENPIVCDCEFHLTWQWLHKYHVQYIQNDLYNYYDKMCNGSSTDWVMSSLQCNISSPNVKQENNSTNDFSYFTLYIEPIVLILIFISGLCANGLLIYIIFRYCKKRTDMDAFIIHLTVVDLLSLILNLPLSYWDAINETWELGLIMCRIFIMSKDLMIGLTVYSLTALSLARFVVISTSYSLKGLSKISEILQVTPLLVSVWTLSISLSLPLFFTAAVQERCVICEPHNQIYIKYAWIFQLVVYCAVPATVIGCFNIMTSCYLKKSIREMPGEIKVNFHTQNRNSAANILIVLVFAFITSYTPHFLLRVLVAWSVYPIDDVFLLSFFFYCLFFYNTILNPILLFCMSKNFKTHLLEFFQFICGNSKHIPNVRPNTNTSFQSQNKVTKIFKRNESRPIVAKETTHIQSTPTCTNNLEDEGIRQA